MLFNVRFIYLFIHLTLLKNAHYFFYAGRGSSTHYFLESCIDVFMDDFTVYGAEQVASDILKRILVGNQMNPLGFRMMSRTGRNVGSGTHVV